MARSPKMTWERLHQMISSGTGSGFGEKYKPWIQIKRWNPSPVSTQIIKPLPPFKRACHFLSKNEYSLALIFAWLGCEIREQFPLWPWHHPHPATGRNPEYDGHLAKSVGLIEICNAAKILHGNFVGTKIPYIWTMDFCLHLNWVSDFTRATTMISAKPLKQVCSKSDDALNRTIEKLEIERRYCKSLGIQYQIADHNAFERSFVGNLELLQPAAGIPTTAPLFEKMQLFLNKHEPNLSKLPLTCIDEILIKDFKCDVNNAVLIRNHLVWHQIIDVNLSKPLIPSQVPCQGGREYKIRLRKILEGIQ